MVHKFRISLNKALGLRGYSLSAALSLLIETPSFLKGFLELITCKSNTFCNCFERIWSRVCELCNVLGFIRHAKYCSQQKDIGGIV